MAVRDELERIAERTRLLRDAVRQVTLEEFRTEDAHFERDSRLGRELLYLIANNEWCRRTTETVDIGQVEAVDTEVVVDVDLAYVDHEAFQPEEGMVWLPLLALPMLQRTHRRPGQPSPEPEPITSLDVTDAAGARVPKMTQGEVHQRLSAALSEIVLNVMANRAGQTETGIGGEIDREQKLLLSAAIRRLLPGAASSDGESGSDVVPAGVASARARLDAALSRDLAAALNDVAALDEPANGSAAAGPQDPVNGGRPRPVMGSQVGEILWALVGTVFVVVAVAQPDVPLSYTVHVPSRRLRQFQDGWRRQPRARVSIDLLAPTTHADRRIKLLLPDGVVCLDGERAADERDLARIDVLLPGPFERVGTLMGRLLPDSLEPDRAVSWVDARIAEMTLHKVDAALDTLRHYDVAAVGGHAPKPTRLGGAEALTEETQARLRRLRSALLAVQQAGPARAVDSPDGRPGGGRGTGPRSEPDGPIAQLHRCWAGGSWYPSVMRRRLLVNTASPGAVLIRATAVEDISKRARPTRAQIDADVAVEDSPLFNVARYTGTLNLVVLGAVTLLLTPLAIGHTNRENLAETLATVLTLFSAVQASRVEHPDTSTLRGLLSRASYWMMLASILPTVLLAVSIAVLPVEWAAGAAALALVCQAGLWWRLQQGPLFGSLRDAPRLTLATEFGPDHARADILRGRRSRDLLAEALRLDREAYAYVVRQPTGEDQFASLLERSQGVVPEPPPMPPARAEQRVVGNATRAMRAISAAIEAQRSRRAAQEPMAETVNLLGVVQSATTGQAMTYLVFRERPPGSWDAVEAGPDGVSVHPVPLDPDRLTPMEPAEWILEAIVGFPVLPVVLPLADHPLREVVGAAGRNNFRVLSVQLPAPPPPTRRDDQPRRWMRLRIAVPYRRGDSLRGLGSFLYRMQRLDGRQFGGGTVVADVVVSPDQPPMPPLDRSQVLTDRDFDVVPDEEAADDRGRRWRTLAFCGQSRTGLLSDVLARLADERPNFGVAGMTAAVVHGQTVLFVLGRDVAGGDQPLSDRLPHLLRPGDQMSVVVDTWQSARSLDGEPADDRLLLRVSIRTPDRPGLLRDMLRHLEESVTRHAPPGVTVTGLDVWFVLLQVVNGRSTRGRLTVRLPGNRSHWQAWSEVNWRAVGRDIGRAAALSWGLERAGSPGVPGIVAPLLDDIVVTVDLLRTTAPLAGHDEPVPAPVERVQLPAAPAEPTAVPTPNGRTQG